METHSALPALCGEKPLDAIFVVIRNKMLSKTVELPVLWEAVTLLWHDFITREIHENAQLFRAMSHKKIYHDMLNSLAHSMIKMH